VTTITYHRNGQLVPHAVVTIGPAGKPVDEMTTADLKAEYVRRLPCCGQADEPPAAAQGG
jgi:hypothetical protein